MQQQNIVLIKIKKKKNIQLHIVKLKGCIPDFLIPYHLTVDKCKKKMNIFTEIVKKKNNIPPGKYR